MSRLNIHMGIPFLFQLLQCLPHRVYRSALPPHLPNNHAAGKCPKNVHFRKRLLYSRFHCTNGLLSGVRIAGAKADHKQCIPARRQLFFCQAGSICQICLFSLFPKQLQRFRLRQNSQQLHAANLVRHGFFPCPPQNSQTGAKFAVLCQLRFQFPTDRPRQ